MFRRIVIALVLVLFVSGAAGAWFWWHMQPPPQGEAYVVLDGSPLWDGTGPVRRLLQKLPWGARLSILDHYKDSVKVRTAQGQVGWTKGDNLVDPDVWQRLGELAARVRQMTTQSPGHTSVLSNLRLDPGRTSPRIGQLRRNTPVDVLARGVATWNGGTGGTPQKQDWLLVRAHTPDGGQVAGWTLGDFIQEDLPDPLPAYASSSGVDPVAWFALRKVQDPRAGLKPNYLLAGSSGPEGQPCDFTRISVYTWSIKQQHYATAFTQGNLCGHLPIQVTFSSDPQQDVFFSFQNLESGAGEVLSYRMRSTIVRPLRSPTSARSRPRPR